MYQSRFDGLITHYPYLLAPRKATSRPHVIIHVVSLVYEKMIVLLSSYSVARSRIKQRREYKHSAPVIVTRSTFIYPPSGGSTRSGLGGLVENEVRFRTRHDVSVKHETVSDVASHRTRNSLIERQ